MNDSVISPGIHTRLRILLACLLLGMYLLVYVKIPDSADGNALLAVSAALFRSGSPDMNAVAYSEAFLPLPQSRMGSPGVDGALYSKKGLTPSLLLLPLVAASEWLPWLTTRATGMFFNPLVTTATALALYTFAVWLGFRTRTAFVVGLIYGLCTFAFVYTKTLFGEPLAGLLLLLALMSVYYYHQRGRLGALAWAGLLLGLLVGVNTIYALVLGLGGVYGLLVRPLTTQPPLPAGVGEGETVRLPQKIRAILSFVLPTLAILLTLALFNWARFGSPLDTGYRFNEGEGFTHPFLLGMYGQFLSPYRGLFWYNPVLLLALPGWWILRRQHRWIAWALLGLALLQGVLFASWWSWHGGVTWGARFLVPAVPLLALCLAPLLDRMWRSRRLFLVVSLLAVISFGVQLLGVLYSYAPYANFLNATVWHGDFSSLAVGDVGSVLYSVGSSPITGHLALAMGGWQLEPAWLAEGVDIIHLLAALALIALGIFLAGLRQSEKQVGKSKNVGAQRAAPLPEYRSFHMISSCIRVVTAVAGVLIVLNVVGARQSIRADVQRIQAIQQAIQPADRLYAMTGEFGAGLLDIEGRTRVITVNAPTEPEDSLWDYALRQGERTWLLIWFPPADPLNWQERALWETAAFVTERPVEGHRAIYFHRSRDPHEEQAAGWRFGDITMETYAIQPVPDGVRLTVRWSADDAPAEVYSWFIHLINPIGEIAAQQDRQPQGGYVPTDAWTPGQVITDRLLFPVQVHDLSGWKLRIGFIRPATGERLPVTAPDGTANDEGYVEIEL